MADYFVDPSIAADSGAGTVGDPYGDLQHALDTISQDAAGDRINIKSGTAEILAAPLDLTSYGTLTSQLPLTLRGYATAQGDADFEAGTGIGEIDCNGEARLLASESLTGIQLEELEIHNTTGRIFEHVSGSAFRCEFHNGGNDGFYANPINVVSTCAECHFHDIAGHCIHSESNAVIIDNFIETGSGSNEFTYAIFQNASGGICQGNIIHIAAGHAVTANGIQCYGSARHNSILGQHSGTGFGIDTTNAAASTCILLEGNLIEGWNGIGGIGIGGDEIVAVVAHNYVCLATTAYDNKAVYAVDNETSESTPFAKSGALTFANRVAYFQPVATGNIIGALSNGRNKGAVHRV